MRNAALALVGLAIVAFLCVQLLRGAVTLEEAALRAVVTVVVLGVADRLLVPIGRALLDQGAPAEPRRARDLGPAPEDARG